MLKNIGANWLFALVQILVMVQLTPVQVQALGAGPNGAWLTVASLTSILSLLILGIPMASVRFIAQHAAERDSVKVNEAISTCLRICIALGAGALVIGALLSFFFEHTYLASPDWQTLGPRWLGEARVAYWITIVTVSFGFVSQLPFGIMDAHHDFVARNTVRIAGLFFRLVLTIVVLRIYPSLIAVAVIQTVVMLAEFSVALLVIRRRWPTVRFGLRNFDRSQIMPILNFSVFAMLLNMGAQLAFRSDALVIGANLDPSQGTVFDIGNKFFPPLTALVLGIGMVLMPTATKLQAEGRTAELRPIFLKWSKISFSLALMIGAYLLVLGPEFVTWWMGHEFAGPSGRIIRVLMVAYLLFLPARGVAVPILMGLGRPVLPGVLFLVMGVVNLVMSLLFVNTMGTLGVAIGTAIPCILFAIAMFWLTCQELEVSPLQFAVHVIGKPTIGILPVALFLVWLKLSIEFFPHDGERTTLFLPLVIAGLAAVLFFALILVVYVYREDPHFDLKNAILRRVRARMRETEG